MNELRAWYDPDEFYFNKFLLTWRSVIFGEAIECLRAGEFEPHDNSIESDAKTAKISSGWQQLRLLSKGKPTKGSARAPQTLRLLQGYPEITSCARGLAYFSLIPAGGSVGEHTSRFEPRERIRHQMALKSTPKATITVNGETRQWVLGEVLTFDDSFPHSVCNMGDESRIVLIYDSIANKE